MLFSAEAADAADAASSSVGRCIQTHYPILVLVVVVVTPYFMILVAAATIIHLMDCLYDGFMDRKSKRIAEEPFLIGKIYSSLN